MKREEKENRVKELKEDFDRCDSFYLVDFIKMPVSQSVELRKQFREQDYSFRIVKNRLAIRALKKDMPEDLKSCFQGPTAIAFASQDPIKLAQIIKDFSTQHKVLTVKGGMLEGQFFPGEKFGEIASLKSRADLVAKFAYIMAYPLIKLSRTWQAPLNSLGRLLGQLKNKK